ncbi:hypothetical protein ASF00_07500 [Sphingomonas sp. Leaf34]|uniref:IS66 family transposase n=1 Tax=Sphingomonas sp. Leaf34 TaxID=1736216 RepID=UPI0006FF7CE9|nr:transposase [Sphingomonas sp. Leaf34]KQN30557.1 hypothetical protein ASF00_07500 [Sphingomonas sp. Leaf34]
MNYIYARQGVDNSPSALADWIEHSAQLLTPLVEALERHDMGGGQLHADDIPVPVLVLGTGCAKTGRL